MSGCRGSTRGRTGSLRRVKSSDTSPEFWSGWVLQLVHLERVENHLAGRSVIVPSRHSTTKWHVELHHGQLDPPISHNFLSKLQRLRTCENLKEVLRIGCYRRGGG